MCNEVLSKEAYFYVLNATKKKKSKSYDLKKYKLRILKN